MSIEIFCDLASGGDIEKSCGFRFQQFVRLLVGVNPDMKFANETDTGGILDPSELETKLNATDSTKVQLIPLVDSLTIPNPETIEEGGGDNTTVKGTRVQLGYQPIDVPARISDQKPEVIQSIEEGYNPLGAVFEKMGGYLIDEKGYIWGKQAGGAGTEVLPIPFEYFTCSPIGTEGFATRTSAMLKIGFPKTWAHDLVQVRPTEFSYLNIENDFVAPTP